MKNKPRARDNGCAESHNVVSKSFGNLYTRVLVGLANDTTLRPTLLKNDDIDSGSDGLGVYAANSIVNKSRRFNKNENDKTASLSIARRSSSPHLLSNNTLDCIGSDGDTPMVIGELASAAVYAAQPYAW